MKRFVVIGLGNFGSAVAESLAQAGHDVIAVDTSEATVDRIAARVTTAVVADGRDARALERIGVKDCDAGVVSTGDDITASILAHMALRDLKVDEIVVKVISNDHERVMKKLGASEIVFPERDSGQRLAKRLMDKTVLNFVRLGEGFSIQEMAVPDRWIGMSLRRLQLPTRHRLNVVAVHDNLTDEFAAVPNPDAPLKDSDTLFVAGSEQDLARVAKLDGG